MKPEDGRIKLENMEDVRRAEHAILLGRKVTEEASKTPADQRTIRVNIAQSEEQLPLLLGDSKTAEVTNGLQIAVDHELSFGEVTPAGALEWLGKLGVIEAPAVGKTALSAVGLVEPQGDEIIIRRTAPVKVAA